MASTQPLLALLLAGALHFAAKAQNTVPNLSETPPSGLTYSTMIHALDEKPSELPGALVRDLHVRVEKNERVREALQLHIEWKPPEKPEKGFQMPIGYTVTVQLFNHTEKQCKSDTRSFYTNIEPDEKELLVPPKEKIDKLGHDYVLSELVVREDCAYNVTVESDPYHRGPAASVLYVVPKCIAPCTCRAKPPTPSGLKVQELPDGRRNVTWKLPTDVPNTHRVAVQLGEKSFNSNSGRPVYVPLWKEEREEPAAPVGYEVLDPSDLKTGQEYLVQVRAMDEINCTGEPADLPFWIASPMLDSTADEKQENQPLLMVLLPVISIVLGSCLGFIMVWQRWGGWCRRKFGDGRHSNASNSWIYKYVNTESTATRLNFPIHQERSVIYVEQEIEEAKERGDADKYEVSYSRLVLGRQIGKGAFGRVFLAKADAIGGVQGFQIVAVKKLQPRATADEEEEFLAEIAMMKKVGRHPNIVTMLGCCTIKKPFCMLMEYIPHGDLLGYLRRLRVEYERMTGGKAAQWLRKPPGLAHDVPHTPTPQAPQTGHTPRYIDLLLSPDPEDSYVQPDGQYSTSSGNPSITETECTLLNSEGTPNTSVEPYHKLECILDSKELQHFAVQIARGMAHLEMKQITHRDLAARNVLIDRKKTLKISDFGLSRTGIYVNTKRKKVPLRWLSVEAMRDNLYSSKSDVWAFAIVLWEIGTLGGFPYPTVGDMNLLSFLMDGKRLEKPDNCSDELYSLMLKCWSYSPDARPSFEELVQHLDSVICRKHVYVDFNNLGPNYTFPPTEEQTVENSSQSAAQKQSTNSKS